MEVHGTSGLTEIAVAAKVDFESFDERIITTSIGFEERAKHFVVKVLKFALLIEVEEQAVELK